MFEIGDVVEIINPPRELLVGMKFVVTKASEVRVSIDSEYDDGVPCCLGVSPDEIKKVGRQKVQTIAEEETAKKPKFRMRVKIPAAALC